MSYVILFILMMMMMFHFLVQLLSHSCDVVDPVFSDAEAKWLVHRTPDREARVRTLAESLCCVLGKDTLLSQCPALSTQE